MTKLSAIIFGAALAVSTAAFAVSPASAEANKHQPHAGKAAEAAKATDAQKANTAEQASNAAEQQQQAASEEACQNGKTADGKACTPTAKTTKN